MEVIWQFHTHEDGFCLIVGDWVRSFPIKSCCPTQFSYKNALRDLIWSFGISRNNTGPKFNVWLVRDSECSIIYKHGTLMRPGIRWQRIVQRAKIFQSSVKYFWIPPRFRSCRTVIRSMQLTFHKSFNLVDGRNKIKLIPAFFLLFTVIM